MRFAAISSTRLSGGARALNISSLVHTDVMRSPEKKFRRRQKEIRTEKDQARQFMQLVKRFRAAEHPDKIKRLGDELGRMIFGG